MSIYPSCVKLAALYWVLAVAAWGGILDRIAVSVGKQVVTSRDVEREIRVTSFLNGIQPDLAAANRRTTAERMVEQKLIRAELENSRFPVPPPEEVEPILEQFKKDNFPADADYQRALTQYGITDQDVRNMLLWQRTLLQFVGLRFRPAVRITDQQIEDYFSRVVAPAARAAHPADVPILDEYRDQIEQKLTDQEADRELDNWLRDARRRTQIVFHPEAFQ